MVETITPMVHGGSRSRWAVSVTLHVAAATLVAAAFGAALGATGGALGAPWGSAWAVLVVAVSLAALLREMGVLGFAVPQLRRQVPNWWRTYFGPYAAAALYGGALGVGFLTFVRHTTLLVVVAAAASTGDPVLGAVIVAPFGLARAAATGLAGLGRQAETVDRLSAFAATSSALAVVNAAAAGVVAVVAAPALADAALDDAAGVAAATIAVAFAWGAAWKAVRFGTWRGIVASYGLGPLRGPAVIGVPVVEAAVAVAVLAGRGRAAAMLALAFLATASLAVALARRRGMRRLRCGCFGAAEIDTGRALVRNAALGAVAALAALGGGTGHLAVPRTEVLPLALVAGGVAGIAAITVLVHRALGPSRIARGGS
jgi:hypothetical protein